MKDHIVERIVNAEIKATYFVRIGAYYLGRYNDMTSKFDEARTFENSRQADMAFKKFLKYVQSYYEVDSV